MPNRKKIFLLHKAGPDQAKLVLATPFALIKASYSLVFIRACLFGLDPI